MDAKLLNENGWKTISQKYKIKDNGLLRALSSYQRIEEGEHDDLLEGIASVNQLANALKKAKEIASVPPLAKYLADLLSAAETAQREIMKAKAAAAKDEATNRKKAEPEGEDNEEEAEEDEAYHLKLLAAFQKLKGAKDLSYEFIVCDAKPHCGLMLARKISSKHKLELTRVTGGSKRFLHAGTCRVENGKFTFTMEQPASGLARKLQDSIKHFTGKKIPIVVGAESAEAEEGQVAGAQSLPQPDAGQKPATAETRAAGAAAAKPHAMAHLKLIKPQLANAPDVWRQTRKAIETHVGELRAAIRKEYAIGGPELLAEIDKNMRKLDRILDTLDHKLADSMAKAHSTENPTERQAELKNSKLILANYIKFVKSEPMIGHIDSNPFGVQTNLKQMLTDSLTHMAQAIG